MEEQRCAAKTSIALALGSRTKPSGDAYASSKDTVVGGRASLRGWGFLATMNERLYLWMADDQFDFAVGFGRIT